MGTKNKLISLWEKGIENFESYVPNRGVKQVFFFDPDGNGLDVTSLLPQ